MTLITRAQWGARSAQGTGNNISAHPLGVAVHWAAANVGNQAHDLCANTVRNIQRFHMDTRGYADVAYSFLVCQHGNVFEGRGIGKGSAANGTTKANLDYYAVCTLTGPKDVPTGALLDGIGDAIDRCRRAGADHKVVGHRDLFATDCPGGMLYGFVQAGRWSGAGPRPPKVTPPPKVTRPPSVPPKPKRVLLVIDGDFGPTTKRRLQQWAGVTQDGDLGPITWKAIQLRVGVREDGDPGPITWKAIQRLVGAKVDGVPGDRTYAALQRFLNGQP